jgi:hypothetical protein
VFTEGPRKAYLFRGGVSSKMRVSSFRQHTDGGACCSTVPNQFTHKVTIIVSNREKYFGGTTPKPVGGKPQLVVTGEGCFNDHGRRGFLALSWLCNFRNHRQGRRSELPSTYTKRTLSLMLSVSEEDSLLVANFRAWLRSKGAYLHPALRFAKGLLGITSWE